jgi:ABC-type multidrug transport system ATPase subunit
LFEVAGLSYTYSSGRAGLADVSLQAGPGERVVIMGPNGSGKSTLLRLVSTELPAPRGTLRLFGSGWDSTSRRLASRRLRGRLGIVQDQAVHFDELTGMENGLLFAELYGVGEPEAEPRLAALFSNFGLEAVRDVEVGEYSYGMRKKLLLAEALVHDPELLILDEPTLGLDPPSQAAFLEILEDRSASGTCSLIATNEPGLARQVATNVVFLSKGEVVAQGAPDELLEGFGGKTTIEVSVTGHTADTIAVEGATVTAQQGRVVAESDMGTEILPDLTTAILATGLEIVRIDVREPDLADLFTTLTGLHIADTRSHGGVHSRLRGEDG